MRFVSNVRFDIDVLVHDPLWYQEGVAEFYSTFTVKGKRWWWEAFRRRSSTRSWRRLMPLRRVFAIDTASKEYNDAHAGPFT